MRRRERGRNKNTVGRPDPDRLTKKEGSGVSAAGAAAGPWGLAIVHWQRERGEESRGQQRAPQKDAVTEHGLTHTHLLERS